MTDFALARRNMVEGQLRPNRVTNTALLAALGELPRERFLPDSVRSVAYADEDVPLGGGRYLMEPMVLARLIQTLQPQPEDRGLVVGAARGYGAALLARLVKAVTALESDPVLAAAGEQTTKDLGLADVQWITGKLEQGVPGSAPYDVILIEGAVPEIPPAVLAQLRRDGGRLVTVLKRGARVGQAVLCSTAGGGRVDPHPVFDCAIPVLPMLKTAPGFVF